MKPPINVLLYALAFAVPVAPLRAQLVADGATNTLAKVTNTFPGFGLQESLSLSPVAWSNSPSGETNPITLPASGQTRFFRLFKP